MAAMTRRTTRATRLTRVAATRRGHRPRRFRPLLGCGLVGVAAWLLACNVDMADVSRAQYPADFHYITKQQIRGQMAELAKEVVALDALLSQPSGPRDADTPEILEILKRMRTAAGQLKTGEHSNHPRLDRNIPRLREDIDRAIAEVQMSKPPIYYRAGQVVGACTYCHVPRHEGSY